MNLLITPVLQSAELVVPINLIFWGSVIVYLLHIIEESIMGEVFVDKVKRLYWSEYSWTKFAGFNTLLVTLNLAAVIVYDSFGGAWLIFPLSLFVERLLNGIYHLFETLKNKQYSSGLLTSFVLWVLGYFAIRYSIAKGAIEANLLIVSFFIGLAIETFMMGSLFMINKWRRNG